jgi:hypothetical protein
MIEYKSNPSLNDDFDKPKEANYFETNRTDPNELPWETPKEEWREEFDNNLIILGIKGSDLEFMRYWLKQYTENLLLTQRQEIVGMIEKMKKEECLCVSDDHKPCDESYNQALSDLSERIGVHKPDEK